MTNAVERVTLTHVQIPRKEPFRVAGGEVTIKDALILTVESADGVGLGECSPTPTPTHADDPAGMTEACWNALAGRIAPGLLGRAFGNVEAIAALAEGWRAPPPAIAAAEAACWDLLGQSRHATIAEMLGVLASPLDLRIESGLSVRPCATIVELLKTIDTHLEEGYRRVKIQIRPGGDVELVRAVRQHFGDIPLLVDGDGHYAARDIDALRALEEFDLLMIEQPMPADDLAGLAALQKAITTPVCLDQTADTLARTKEAIARGACRIVNLKIQRVGGLSPALAMHDLCQAEGIACWVGTMPELGIGKAQAIHLAALPNCKYPTDIQPGSRWFVDDLVIPPIEHASPGVFTLPTRPGLGHQLDPVKLRRYQVRRAEFPA